MKNIRITKRKILSQPNANKTLKLRPCYITLTITRYLLIGVVATALTGNTQATPKKASFKLSIAMVATHNNQYNLFKNKNTHDLSHELNRKNNFANLFNNRHSFTSALKNKSPAVMLRFDNKDTSSSFGVMAGPKRIGFMFVLSR